jgi:hypothetical protein
MVSNYAQENKNDLNKTWAFIVYKQLEVNTNRTSFLCGNRNGSKNVKSHNRTKQKLTDEQHRPYFKYMKGYVFHADGIYEGTGYEYDGNVFVTWVLQVRRVEVVTKWSTGFQIWTPIYTDPTEKPWWTRELAKGKQFLLLIRHPPCYSYIQSIPVR